ncbi:MAG: D-alanyl-D-alanine carboxypeptidase [Alphaproteobacteria bacterium]|nr:D-alanyl-D-alanine carboxypeptidase [Alphaproteobacteria bacterium]
MVCVPFGASRSLRLGCLGLAAVVGFLAVATDPADARRRHKRSHGKSVSSSYNPPYAAIVVDAKNGSVLHSANPDAPRHPASLTKIMTLYLLFERLESGKITLDTQMPVSEEASSQAPTKLGLRPSDTLKVEDAIKALVTESANDASVVLAEAMAGGDADEFARMMTRKARALGMRNTTYRNPNGLPNDEQITTARDQALLGIAIQERFPKYYRYFSTPSFTYRGSAMRNHNRLLGQVEGVDGIKTGFTRDSGFNLVTSVRRGPRQIVAVVLGGRSAVSRDTRMRGLIEETIAQASTKQTAPAMVAEAPKPEFAPAGRSTLASIDTSPIPPRANETTAAIMPGSSAPLTPVKVKTVSVKVVSSKAASANAVAAVPAAKPEPIRTASAMPQTQDEALAETLAAAAPIEAAPPPPPGVFAKPPAAVTKPPAAIATINQAALPPAKAEPAPSAKTSTKASDHFASVPRHTVRTGWAVQVGAYEDEDEAKQKLTAAKSKAATALKKGEAYIERTVKGAKTYYRARFAGFDRDEAEAVCKKLKREDVACMALKI